jgi:1-acyl-sn-glycerol-3-phosphate acyltransferase
MNPNIDAVATLKALITMQECLICLSWTVLCVALAFAVTQIVQWRVNYWRSEGDKLQTSGYLPPKPTIFSVLLMRWLTRFLGVFMTGPIKVIGSENLKVNGRAMLIPNHTDHGDFVVVFRALGFRIVRYLAAVEQLTGIRRGLAAFTGAFGVDRSSHRAGSLVVEAATNASITDGARSRILLFMQGKLIRDNVVRFEDLKHGAARIGRKVHEHELGLESAAEFYYIPMGIAYKRDPKHATVFYKTVQGLIVRIRKATADQSKQGRLHKFGRLVSGKDFRAYFGEPNFGAVIVVGEPIPISSLPVAPKEITKVLGLAIQAELEKAKALSA